MFSERKTEFCTMLLLEHLSIKRKDFTKYLEANYDIEKFNNRYKELLDEFLKDYALNKSEKSE